MSQIALTRFIGEWLPPIEAEMRSLLDNNEEAVGALYGMLRYHMGWANTRFDAELAPAGKRLRPIFCLLACAEVAALWRRRFRPPRPSNCCTTSR